MRRHGQTPAGGVTTARLLVLAVIAVGYLLVLNARPDFTICNAHDSEFYLALSRSLVEGRGYTRALNGDYIPHTTFPPGWPVLLMPSVWLSGKLIDWSLVEMTTVFVGMIGMVYSWLLVRRLADARVTDIAALALALNPYYWHFSHIALAEIAVFAWLVQSVLLFDLVWARRAPGALVSVAVGAVAGCGMMFKGSLLGLGLLPLAYWWGPRRATGSAGRVFTLSVVYGLGFTVPFGLWTLRNLRIPKAGLGLDGIDQVRMVMAANPVDPTSPLVGIGGVFRNAVDNLLWGGARSLTEQVLPFAWFDPLLNHASGTYVALAVATILALVLVSRAPRILPLLPPLVVLSLLNLLYAWGGSRRFWFPVSMAVLLALVAAYGDVLRRWPAAVRVAGGAVLLASLAAYVAGNERRPFHPIGDFDAFVDLIARVKRDPFPAAAVLTKNNFAFEMTTGVPAPLTVAAIGVRPAYDHVIVPESMLAAFGCADAPATVVTVAPWHIVRLPQPMRLDEVQTLLRTDDTW
jgi:hypothetical protein